MSVSSSYMNVLKRIPGISQPVGRLTFKQKLKWTGLILFIYFMLAQIAAFGVDHQTLQANNPFAAIQVLLGSKFGSLMTLGIGPIVTASIILQLLVGSKIIPWNLQSDEGKTMFQGTQKLLAIALVFIEGALFVLSGAIPVLASVPYSGLIVILQFAMGGILVIFMDELISKWGFGSGISLFIVAGVSSAIFLQMFSPFTACIYDNTGSCLTLGLLTENGDPNLALPGPTNPEGVVGRIPAFFLALSSGEMLGAFEVILPVIATVIVFLIVIYINAIKVEIPLAFGSVRGFGRRWPLKFLYTSNIPVILTGALLANINIMARTMADQGITFLGTFNSSGSPDGGLIYFLTVSNTIGITGLITFIGMFFLIGIFIARVLKITTWKVGLPVAVIGGALAWFFVSSPFVLNATSLTFIQPAEVITLLTYTAFMMTGAVIFSIFWTMTSGMDAHSVADQIHSTGMQIPGFRRDIRIIERVLERYIPALTILGGLTVGFLASFADATNALGSGTGILLSAMIVYQLYEEITTQHMEDMPAGLRRLIGR